MSADAPAFLGLRRAARARGVAAGGWVRRAGYLPKWVVLGIVIGAVAGVGAIAFFAVLTFATHVFTGIVDGYHAPLPAGEGHNVPSHGFIRPWAIPLIAAAGGLASGFLVFRYAPEAEGHGTDAAIDAIHTNPRKIRSRVVGIKLVASALTMGTGGSGGREGPTAQISAGFGSLLARFLDLSPEDGRIAVSVGIGSGIGAIFGAPLGGAVTSADIVYRDDFESQALVPGFIASITAYAIFGLVDGFSPLFGYAGAGYRFDHPANLLWYALIGVVAGLVGLLYGSTFYGVVALTHRLPGSRMVKPAVGGLLVGLLALAIPQVLGTGYGWIQVSLARPSLLHLSLWIVLLVPFAKILATSLSIGSGGSAGIFGPGMVIGAFVGAAVWRLFEPLGLGIPHDPAAFVIVGMMACFGSIARAPLAVMVMVAEMTGSLTILAPALIAVGIAYLIVGQADQTIYRSQLRNREEAQANRLRTGLPMLGRVQVAEASRPARVLLADSLDLPAALQQLEERQVPGAPVIDSDHRFVGTVDRDALAARVADGSTTTLARVTDPSAASVVDTASVDVALDALPTGASWLTVLDDRRHVAGILSVSDIVRSYHAALREERRRSERVASSLRVHDVTVRAGSSLDGQRLGDTHLPHGAIVMSVRRGDSMLAGTASLTFQAGDVTTVLVDPEHAEDIDALAGDPPERAPDSDVLSPAARADPGDPRDGHALDRDDQAPPSDPEDDAEEPVTHLDNR